LGEAREEIPQDEASDEGGEAKDVGFKGRGEGALDEDKAEGREEVGFGSPVREEEAALPLHFHREETAGKNQLSQVLIREAQGCAALDEGLRKRGRHSPGKTLRALREGQGKLAEEAIEGFGGEVGSSAEVAHEALGFEGGGPAPPQQREVGETEPHTGPRQRR